jgi:hypothetical protein
MWGLEAHLDGGSTRRGRVKFFSIGVNSANSQTAGVASCIHKGTNLKSGTFKFSRVGIRKAKSNSCAIGFTKSLFTVVYCYRISTLLCARKRSNSLNL